MVQKAFWTEELEAMPELVIERVVKKNHVKLYIAAPDGRRTILTTGRTPSDGRGRLNFRAELRKFRRG